MKPETEELLYVLLWSAEMLGRPTFRDLTGSYEGWLYRRGFLRQLQALEKDRFIERASQGDDRLYRLTETGRLHALGGRDPAIEWSRPWDGRWRLVLFDVPQMRHTHRSRLRRFLRERSFGLLQRSVWITPDSLEEIQQSLGRDLVNVNSLILLEARPSGGETDAQIVVGSWDFEVINKLYLDHIDLLEKMPKGPISNANSARDLQKWAAVERTSWLNAVSTDPLLPTSLLPEDYAGKKAAQTHPGARQRRRSVENIPFRVKSDVQNFVPYGTKFCTGWRAVSGWI